MKDIVKFSMESVKRKLNANNRQYCFELFGYDFIIDDQFKVWLIEVNTNPCLEESSRLLRMLLPRLIDDALKLTVDIIFSKKRTKDYWTKPDIENNYKVTGYNDNENMWEFIVDISVLQKKQKAKCSFKTVEVIPSASTTGTFEL